MSCNLDYKRVLHKGKSFECSKWQPFITYTNDCLKQDFVTCDGALFVCLETHLSSEDNMPKLVYGDPQNPHEPTGTNSQYWGYVLSGFSDWEKLSSDIQKQILESIDGLDTKDTEILGHYVSSVIQDDGKLTIKRRELPTSKISCDNDWLSIQLNQKSGAISDISVQIKDVAKHSDLQTLSDKINKLEPDQHVIKTSWLKLKVLRDGSKLIPGTIYRITDYITTTTQPQTRSAEHQFDILVIALDEKTLSENAAAIIHEGDEYFSINGSNLLAWELKYSLDNDSNRFYWADENGKGVIYYMKDEWNNECPYDFKNIMFLRDITIDADSGLSAIASKSDITQAVYCYTFNYRQTDGMMLDTSVYGNNGTLLMFGVPSEVSFNKMNALNTIGLMNLPGINIGLINYSLKQYFLNHIVFYVGGGIYYGPTTHNIFGICCQNMTFGNSCSNNSFGDRCYNNSFGHNCTSNTFGDMCYTNTFGENCTSNSFRDMCYSNSFGNGCGCNSFVDSCHDNSFGESCFDNSFGNSCHHNSFGVNCSNNSFENYCSNNSFVNSCHANSFGYGCTDNSFGDGCSGNSFGNECYNNSFEGGCYNNSFGNGCYDNSFGNDCYNNSFGLGCYNNSFEFRCPSNSFGDGCYSNSFGYGCRSNSFGSGCQLNSFEFNCSYNSFEVNCSHNSFRNNCNTNSFGYSGQYNSLGDSCYYNSFGNKCIGNSFGNSCRYNSFGDNCNYNLFRNSASETGTLKNYCEYNHFDDGCSFNVIWNSDTTSSSILLKNINVNRGVCGKSSSYNMINIDTLNQDYEIQVSKNSKGEIKIYCEADLID